jgi:hypothetical protein
VGKFILRAALWLIGFTLAAAAAPTAAMIAAISIIGLPIAIILEFLPAVIALAAIGDLTRLALPRWPAPKAAFAGVTVFLIAGMVYALAFTMQARGEARSLVAGDFDRLEGRPPSARWRLRASTKGSRRSIASSAATTSATRISSRAHRTVSFQQPSRSLICKRMTTVRTRTFFSAPLAAPVRTKSAAAAPRIQF